MFKLKTANTISDNLGFSVLESISNKKVPDGMMKVKGIFFTPDRTSENGRMYPKELWENVLNDAEVKQQLEDGRMYGLLEHPLNNKVAPQDASHIVTDLYIDQNGKGIGEAIILDTPAGNVVQSFIKAGTKMGISSRGFGDYLPGKKAESGGNIMDPNNFKLKTFDMTLDPAFTEANPQMVESVNKLFGYEVCASGCNVDESKKDTVKESKVDNDNPLVAVLTEENVNLKNELNNAIQQLESKLENTPEEQEQEQEVDKKEKFLDKCPDEAKITSAKVELNKFKDVLQEYASLGTPEELSALAEELKILTNKMDKLHKENNESTDLIESLTKDVLFFRNNVKDLNESLSSEKASTEKAVLALKRANKTHQETIDALKSQNESKINNEVVHRDGLILEKDESIKSLENKLETSVKEATKWEKDYKKVSSKLESIEKEKTIKHLSNVHGQTETVVKMLLESTSSVDATVQALKDMNSELKIRKATDDKIESKFYDTDSKISRLLK